MKKILFLFGILFLSVGFNSCSNDDIETQPQKHKIHIFIDSDDEFGFNYDYSDNDHPQTWTDTPIVYPVQWDFDRTIYESQGGYFKLKIFPMNGASVTYTVTIDGTVVADETVYQDDYFEYNF